ncbi:MAG: murein biosynthesis integral membrane protein MurJ [Puniceicoccales bacterium]|jgi:putative peptidoglycan lipid II flippase|nr:murein biosynthesis integral membrane protein MurJ [Puniceicoccales bacterium]
MISHSLWRDGISPYSFKISSGGIEKSSFKNDDSMNFSRKFFGISFITSFSRLFGLVRDVVMFATFGTSLFGAAFLFAFTLPNLFRRLLGEGALTSALIPIFSQEYHQKDREAAFQLFNQVLSWAILLLVGLVVAGMLLLWALSGISGLEERWSLGFRLAIILMPFMFFICLTALFSAILNVLGCFFLAAAPAIGLNVAMIASLVMANCCGFEPAVKVYCLSGGVLLGGIIPMVTLVMQLRRQCWHWRLDLGPSSALKEVRRLFLPGLGGAAITQCNVAISRMLAFSLQTNAISLLYMANRLIELPLGIFIIAITTLFFPRMARSFAVRNDAEFVQQCERGVLSVLVISIPSAMGLYVLAKPILLTLFSWGQFRAVDVASALPILRIFSLALPFYALSTFLTRVYHARKNTRLPVKASLCAFGVNLSLTLWWMHAFGVQGIAWANTLAVVFQTFYLQQRLSSLGMEFSLRVLGRPMVGIMIATAIMGATLWVASGCRFCFQNASRAQHMGLLVWFILMGVGLYLSILAILRGYAMFPFFKWCRK